MIENIIGEESIGEKNEHFISNRYTLRSHLKCYYFWICVFWIFRTRVLEVDEKCCVYFSIWTSYNGFLLVLNITRKWVFGVYILYLSRAFDSVLKSVGLTKEVFQKSLTNDRINTGFCSLSVLIEIESFKWIFSWKI